MTQQEFVIAESEKYVDNSKPVERDECSWQIVDESFTDGLTKGLEVAKEFAEWVSELRNANAVLRIIDKRPADELLTIFLTEKYGK